MSKVPGRVNAQRAGDLGRGVRHRGVQAAGGHDDGVDVGRAAGPASASAFALARAPIDDDRVVLAGEPAFGDADPAADPLVVGVHDLRQFVVGDHPVRPEMAEAR